MQKQPSLVVLKSTRNVMMLWSCDEITTLDQKQKMLYFVFLMLNFTHELRMVSPGPMTLSRLYKMQNKKREKEREKEREQERERESMWGGESVCFSVARIFVRCSHL